MDIKLKGYRFPITKSVREQVLLKVREYPELYDKMHQNYHDIVSNSNAWDQITRATGFTGQLHYCT